MVSRRKLLKTLTLAAGTIVLPKLVPAQEFSLSNIGSQNYTWHTFYQREGKKWDQSKIDAAKALKAAGYNCYEPSFTNPDEVQSLLFLVKQENIKINSFYINSILHDKEQAENSIKNILEVSNEAKKLGAKIVVTNPTPIRWGGEETKSDEQLIFQALMLEKLGKELRGLGMTLAYHTHDPEMKLGAREFHHMMVNTSPENVSLCLDTHWVYRGTGNSGVALMDIVKMYTDRIVELHLRQSVEGIWSETLSKGDIDYAKIAEYLKSKKITPYLVVEQAVEKGTPHTMEAIKAISNSRRYVEELFK